MYNKDMKIYTIFILLLIFATSASCSGTKYYFIRYNENDTKQHQDESNFEYLHRLDK